MPQRHVIGAVADIPPGSIKAVSVGTKQLVVCNADGRFYAVDNRCPHDGAPLAEGSLDGTTLICPWHNAEFDITCGRHLCPPAMEDIGAYPVFVNAGKLEVEV